MRRLWRSGEPFVWLTGGALALALVMVAGLVGIILANALGFFWPRDVVRLTLADDRVLTGRVAERESVPGRAGQYRVKLQVANRDLYGADFVWVDEASVRRREAPAEVAVVERTEWGLLIGTPRELRDDGRAVATGAAEVTRALARRLPAAARLRAEIRKIERRDIGALNHAQEQARLALRRLALRGVTAGPEVQDLERRVAGLQARYREQEARLAGLRATQTASVLVAADGGKDK
ncbi:MAG TPA: phosphate ABC transporter, permease protein PstA, partial [Methylomirabilota bacterium]|nr:phosphate ABC transporter, permease protein PstA [Methylomirabilota bacterium]